MENKIFFEESEAVGSQKDKIGWFSVVKLV